MENYYKTLGISPKSSQAEIKERFRFLANAYHPDKFSSPAHKANAEAEFKKINQAYQVLSIPNKRAEYDLRLGLKPSTRMPNSGPKQPARQQNDIYAFGQAVIRTIVFAFLFYIASFIAMRMGISGVVLFLIFVAVIYLKYFWK